MTITIELTEEQAAALKARAADQGVTLQELLQRLAEQHAQSEVLQAEKESDLPIWEKIVDIMKDLPNEVLDKLPPDGASQHDHYIYGLPKRNQ